MPDVRSASEQGKTQKPDLVFAMTDTQGVDRVGIYAHPELDTAPRWGP